MPRKKKVSVVAELWSDSAYQVQKVLYSKDGATLREIVEETGLDRVTVWRRLTQLMRFGLVKAEIVIEDGRQVKLFKFTDKGRKAFEHILAFERIVVGDSK